MSRPVHTPDFLIIGGGPAGLSAAIYAARAKMDTVVLESLLPGGQMRNTVHIENLPGFERITGENLSEQMGAHAQKLGAHIERFSPVLSMRLKPEEDGRLSVETKKAIYRPRAVLLATGASPKRLPIPEEARFAGKGIHYCAICDGAFYEEQIVGVVGGGNSALEESLLLADLASKVLLIRRKNSFNGEQWMIDQVLSNPKIEVLFNRDLVHVEGDSFVERAILRDTVTGEESSVDLSAIFGYIGTDPKVELFADQIALSPQNYILTDDHMATNLPGVYAAGDVREKKIRQITTALSDGTIAALSVEKFLKQREKTS